ncbi:hypothetical protein HZA97_06390 [Candidatus Woesearchaeota archaeon]|nr:hypothetical protein [Candidatus Woesearchaeota archaeon]
MNKKVVLLVVFLVLIAGIAYYFYPKTQQFSDKPKDWFDKNKLDVSQATKGKEVLSNNVLQYKDGETISAFSLEGFFKGKKFLNEYKDNNKPIMRITQDLIPNDGIIDGFIFEKIENGVVKAYLFVDEDWKNLVGKTNILWGNNFQNSQEFSYDQVKPGIYMNVIIDDPARFNEDYSLHFGGVMLGDISKEDAKDKTIIVLK